MMAQKFYERFSWVPARPQDKTEKPVYRRGCCGLAQICRRRAQSLDYYPDRASVRECMKLLEECLADGGRARDAPTSCRCREWLQDPCSLAVVLSRRHEEERRLRGALKSPFPLLRALFLQMDTMRRWQKVLTADPWLQDLLEVCSAVLVPRPRGMCVSCRERQAVGSEVSAGGRHKPSNGQAAGSRAAGGKPTIDLYEYRQPGPEYTDKDFSWTEERSDRSRQPGLWASIQQLKNSLKKDLETHQLYLSAIETRLSGMERRAQDVTRHLERANLELEAIKHGSVTLKTLVGEQTSSPVTEDVAGSLRSARPECCARNDPGRRCASKYPAGGGTVPHRKPLQGGLSTCQRHVDVLIQQITQQINQMESDIQITSKQRQSAG